MTIRYCQQHVYNRVSNTVINHSRALVGHPALCARFDFWLLTQHVVNDQLSHADVGLVQRDRRRFSPRRSARLGGCAYRQRGRHGGRPPSRSGRVGTESRSLRSRVGVAAVHAAFYSRPIARRRSWPDSGSRCTANHPHDPSALVGARKRARCNACDRSTHRATGRLLRKLLLMGRFPSVRSARRANEDKALWSPTRRTSCSHSVGIVQRAYLGLRTACGGAPGTTARAALHAPSCPRARPA